MRPNLKEYIEFINSPEGIKQREKEDRIANKNANIDFSLGLLVGEIIWRKTLSAYTNNTLSSFITEQEEIDMIYALEKQYHNVMFTNRKPDDKMTLEDKIEAERVWYEEVSYKQKLMGKYFPVEIKFTQSVSYIPENIDKFFAGVRHYLWNTDACSYNFSKENIEIEKMGILGKFIHFTFALDNEQLKTKYLEQYDKQD